ncbi:unnamed protein product [Citrullus colocynthis]|uniref:Uncharacterized protein n=1 Tax=Citrullus colocynthis TaxID=252529 RepID=A0ABP0ZFD6_9ROSI
MDTETNNRNPVDYWDFRTASHSQLRPRKIIIFTAPALYIQKRAPDRRNCFSLTIPATESGESLYAIVSFVPAVAP